MRIGDEVLKRIRTVIIRMRVVPKRLTVRIRGDADLGGDAERRRRRPRAGGKRMSQLRRRLDIRRVEIARDDDALQSRKRQRLRARSRVRLRRQTHPHRRRGDVGDASR